MGKGIGLLEAGIIWEIYGKIRSENFCVPGWLFLGIPHIDTVGRKDGGVFELNAWILVSVREIVYVFSKSS